MFCPVCRSEFREGFDRCNNCQVNLVEDLNNIDQPVEGEFMFCRSCDRELHEKTEFCPGCGLKLVRAVLRDDTYFFLEAPSDEYEEDDLEPALIEELEYFTDLSEQNPVVLLESEDAPMLVKLQELLNQEKIPFQYVPAQNPGMLGSILGAGNPLTRSFPKVLVRAQDEERAIRLIATHPALGLCEIPEELLECDDEDDDGDYDDFADLRENEEEDD